MGKRPAARVHRPATCGHRPVSGYRPAASWLQDIKCPVISGQRLTSLRVSVGGQGTVARLRSAASSFADVSCHRTATGHRQAVCGLSATSRRPATRNLKAINGNVLLVSAIGHWSSARRRPAICGRPSTSVQRLAIGQGPGTNSHITTYGQFTAASDLLQTAGLRVLTVSRAAARSQTAASVNRPSGSCQQTTVSSRMAAGNLSAAGQYLHSGRRSEYSEQRRAVNSRP